MLSLLPTGVHHAATSIERRRGDEKITRDLCRHKLIFLSLFGGTLALAGSRSCLSVSLSLSLSVSLFLLPLLPPSLSLSHSLSISPPNSLLSRALYAFFLSLSLTHSLSLSRASLEALGISAGPTQASMLHPSRRGAHPACSKLDIKP